MPIYRVDEDDLQLLLALSSAERKRATLPTLLNWSMRKVDRRLSKLSGYGWVNSPRFGYHAITPPGTHQLQQRQSPQLAHHLHHDALQRIVELLPSQAHQAMFRLVLSGVIAKYHLLKDIDGPWPAFLLAGQTKAFKTSLAHAVCHVFGLDPDTHIFSLQTAVPGEFGVRRVREKRSSSFTVRPSPLFKAPFLCLDEYDKVTDNDVKRNILFFLHGQRNFTVEGKVITNHTCPLIILNPKRADQPPLPEAYMRRCIVLDTGALTNELRQVDVQARKFFKYLESHPSATQLNAMIIHSTGLDEHRFLRLRQLFLDHVVEDHHGLVDTQPLELLVLGRTALIHPKANKRDLLDEALFHTVYDRLLCLETEGHTVSEWRQRVVDRWLQWGKAVDPNLIEATQQAKTKQQKRQHVLKQQTDKLAGKEHKQTVAHLKLIRVLWRGHSNIDRNERTPFGIVRQTLEGQDQTCAGSAHPLDD